MDKKRQKKKKNKQGNNSQVDLTKQNQTVNSDKAGVQQKVVDSDIESINGAEASRSVEAEKTHLLKIETSEAQATLEQKIKELQEQLDVHMQREADLEKDISQAQKERSLWHHKETELETKLLQLQTEKDSWLQKEASFKEKLIQMEEEKVNLAQSEKSVAETIAFLNKDNAILRAQVIELEASRNDIALHNEQLKECVSDLQSEIQVLENSMATRSSPERKKHVTEYEDMCSELESTQALVERLHSENEKLVEKVNILNAELNQKSATTVLIKPDDPIVNNSITADFDKHSASETDPMPSSAEKLDTVSVVGPSPESREDIVSDKHIEPLKDEVIRIKSNNVNHMNSEGSDMNTISGASIGEIVQISLDENDAAVPTTSTTSLEPEKGDHVPLTDAPLIGAPFRLISFVARYVSGADLVQK